MLRAVALALLPGWLVACQPAASISSTPPVPGPAPSPVSQAAPSPTAATRAVVPTVSASPSPSPSAVSCGYGPSTESARLEDRLVSEASGLATSLRTPGAYWTINDSGHEPVLYAFNQAGRQLGRFRVDGAENVDWEALHVGPGATVNSALYIADTGDNRAARSESTIYRVPEPPLEAGGPGTGASTTARAEVFRVAFPDGPVDTEAVLVHPRSGEVVLVTKDLSGRARLYQYPPPLRSGAVSMLALAGELDLRQLGPFVSAITDGAVSPDGRKVVLRTYLVALEYALVEGAPIASIAGQQPRVYQLENGPQGEGITYRSDGLALMTIGESTPAVLYQAPWRC